MTSGWWSGFTTSTIIASVAAASHRRLVVPATTAWLEKNSPLQASLLSAEIIVGCIGAGWFLFCDFIDLLAVLQHSINIAASKVSLSQSFLQLVVMHFNKRLLVISKNLARYFGIRSLILSPIRGRGSMVYVYKIKFLFLFFCNLNLHENQF